MISKVTVCGMANVAWGAIWDTPKRSASAKDVKVNTGIACLLLVDHVFVKDPPPYSAGFCVTRTGANTDKVADGLDPLGCLLAGNTA